MIKFLLSFFGSMVAILAIATTLTITIPKTASAHVLQTDPQADIGAVLHIQPDDAPTTKVPVVYVLSFQANKVNFSLTNCDCNISFILDDKTIQTLPLAKTSTATSQNSFTFEESGAYIFKVTGSPTNGADFTPFTLSYTVRVGGGQADKRPLPALLWVGIGMAIALMLLATYASDYDATKKEKANKKKG